MINALLHRQPVAVDRNEHRSLRLRVPVNDWTVASKLNAMFVAGVEFGDVARDFPIVFVRAGDGEDGKPDIAPIAVLGMVKEDNLYVDGTAWRARYIPAALASYPFAIGRLDADRFAICIDSAWSGLSGTEGEALFTAEGEPSAFMQQVQQRLEALEREVQATRQWCRLLHDLGLLGDMRFDATMPDGSKFAVDGFLTIDEKKLRELPDAKVGELHRNGVLGLIHAHFVSIGHMRKLLDWHIQRQARAAA